MFLLQKRVAALHQEIASLKQQLQHTYKTLTNLAVCKVVHQHLGVDTYIDEYRQTHTHTRAQPV